MRSAPSIARFRRLALLFGAMVLFAVAAPAQPPRRRPSGHWVGTWACSPQLDDARDSPGPSGFKDTTLRQVVHVSIGGRRLRVRFSNSFGRSPLVIASAHIALSSGASAIRHGSDRALTFDGEPSVTIPAGALMVSDPVAFDLAPLSDLAVTVYVKDVPDGITAHPGSRATSYFQEGDEVSAPDLPRAKHVDHWYFLNGIDVASPGSIGAVVVLGDSITDGHGSTTNGNSRWPDFLARRFQANKAKAAIGVLNQGIGGNRLLHDGLGPNALARFDRDVLAQTGVRWLIVLEGVNDIGTAARAKMHNEQPATAADLIAAFKQIILRAHAHNIRVYGATIMPFGGSFYNTPDAEKEREAVNKWIRTSRMFDAVIDMDAATRDPHDQSHLAKADDSGDHLHPGPEGYKNMGRSVDLRLFAK